MTLYNPTAPKKLAFFLFTCILLCVTSVNAQDGKKLFMTKCGGCHTVTSPSTGPALKDFESRGPWGDRNHLYEWVASPAKYQAKYNDPYVAQLIKDHKGVIMQDNPGIADADVDAIVDYINEAANPTKAADSSVGAVAETDNGMNALIFGIISVILAIIALILTQVNSGLKKMSDDTEGILRPEPVPFYRNKIYIALIALVFFVAGGYFLSKGAVALNRQHNYEPEQPIFYSHKVHAGINQINCLYCHGNAWESKTAAIPSTNVCMNCHKSITEYTGADLFDKHGNPVDGTNELKKLFEYAGFDPANPNDWDPSKAKPIEWVKIHNLPDHVYFNHSQHVRVGNVQCQTCHGEITGMDEVKQVSDLSMGWCVNCHRETKVNFNNAEGGNGFYSIYEKFHNDIKAGKMDSVTVKDIGGLECQKCHY